VLLLEHDEKIGRSYTLSELYYKGIDRCWLHSRTIIETWLLDDDTVLMTKLDIGVFTLNITISEVEGSNGTTIPVHIAPEK
jgi:hypothetical protein